MKLRCLLLLTLLVAGCGTYPPSAKMTKKDTQGCIYQIEYVNSLVQAEKLLTEQMKADGINGRIQSTEETTFGLSKGYVSVIRFD